jgi:hypothetical protein
LSEFFVIRQPTPTVGQQPVFRIQLSNLDMPIVGRFSRAPVFVPVLPRFGSERGTLSLKEPITNVVAPPPISDIGRRRGVHRRAGIAMIMSNKFPQSAACDSRSAERTEFPEIVRSPPGM